MPTGPHREFVLTDQSIVGLDPIYNFYDTDDKLIKCYANNSFRVS